MDIVEFFQLSSGRWFSQRNSHHLAFNQSEGGKSNLEIEMLSNTAPEVIQLCEQYQINPVLALCGSRIVSDGTMEWGQKKRKGSTILVPVANPDNPTEGQLLREIDDTEKAAVAGRYRIGRDDTLTLMTEYKSVYSEERMWFASPNLRLRTIILKQFGGFSTASFCSEVRLLGTKP
jgi:hypothetical protein